MAVVTILHISDLHRDSDGHLKTGSLIESLRRDKEKYLEEGISSPDLVIVSGDVVLGVKGSGDSSLADLERQYDEASDFLEKLADLLFEGDRERIILVPGNHDVSHDHVLQSSIPEEIPPEPEKRKILVQKLTEEGSLYRWVSTEFSLRRIHNVETYRRRMKPFADFYSKFYKGTREYSLQDEKQFSLHDFPHLGIAVVGLSSTCDNDLFNRAGRIHPTCIAEATRVISEPIRSGRLAVAVWHHNLAGGPKDSDYIDPEFLQSLIDGGFTVGLHGHQHRAQLLEHRFTADSKRGIAVVSAGTLCGGPLTLPPGRMRGYNLITLDPQAKKGELHVREMKNDGFVLPVWGAAHVTEFNGSSMAFDLRIQQKKKSSKHVAGDAHDLLKKRDYSGAFALALQYPNEPLARRVAVESLIQLDDWQGIKNFCSPPQSNIEIIALLSALDELGDRASIESLIQSDLISKSEDLAVRQMAKQVRPHSGGYH